MTNNFQIHNGKLRNMASVYLRYGDKLLLLYRQGTSIVSNLWIGSAGGHFEEGELNDAKACVKRELLEELSIDESAIKNLSLRYVTLRYANDEIRQNYYFFADLIDFATPLSNEGITKWFTLDELKDIPMPFTARYIIDHYICEGQFCDTLYGGIANDTGMIFEKL